MDTLRSGIICITERDYRVCKDALDALANGISHPAVVEAGGLFGEVINWEKVVKVWEILHQQPA